MNSKNEIMRDALQRIAKNRANGLDDASSCAVVAQAALDEVEEVIEYRITARTWYGRNGGEFKAELRRADTGDIVMTVGGTTWGSDAWSYAMRDKMHAYMPEVFPDHRDGHPTIYFREVCKVDYEHAEVDRKRDL